ncbi:hypothetical protein DH2020_007223 [Rehmannia glutinosa]|uniref:Dehydrogenase E1 component domain-containing protein n=1 Tax=Rehmannia glutinosa TaxID=99300 RepID=A0ABR0TXF4_REHGL
MAMWLTKSRIITNFLKTKICTPNNSYKTLAGDCSRKPRGLWDNSSAAVLDFRRPESARAGGQVEAVAYSDDDDNDANQNNQDLKYLQKSFSLHLQHEESNFGSVKIERMDEIFSAIKPENKRLDWASKIESPEKRVPCYRVLDDDGYPIPGSSFEQVDKETAVKMYRSMVTLQIMDTIFYEAQRQGRISFYLTSMGEEAINIATAAALTSDDVVLPQYFFDVRTQLPQAVGVAYSLKMDNKEACAVAFMGDGCTSEGDFHAGMNFAAVLEAPVIFICRNNGWAISTPISEQFRSDGVVVKGQAYGIRSVRVDGNDTLAVYSAIRTAREMAIREQKPILVEVKIELSHKPVFPCFFSSVMTDEALTYRVGHHSTSDDSTKYRSSNEIEHWRTARNPTTRFRKWVQTNGWWRDEDETELRESIRKQVLNAIQVADKTEKPSLEELFTEVYDRVPPNLREQEKSLRETVKRHQQDFPTDVPV